VAGTYFYRSGGWVAELSAATGARLLVGELTRGQ
jgi:hypothetical protein